MRVFFILFGLMSGVAAMARGDAKPIPQDQARMQQRICDRVAWTRRNFVEAYEKVGKRDPRWDVAARKAIDLYARMTCKQVDPTIKLSEIAGPAGAAIAAGCDDPQVVFFHDRASIAAKAVGPDEGQRRLKASVQAFAASRYPAYRRASALEMVGTILLRPTKPTEADRREAEADFDAALDLLGESVATDERNEFWEKWWFDTFNDLIRGYRKLGVAPPEAFAKVDDVLLKIPELKVLELQLRGGFWYSYGWEARTKAFAPAVPAGGFETLEQRIGESVKALNEAWKLRPDDARTATLLLDIEKTVGGDRDTMELWFDRAMRADGDHYSACLTKLDWLDPKWHGNADEMLAFGRACRATGNWRAGITLLVGDAHNRYRNRLAGQERLKYLASPPVWSEIKAVYDEYLRHYPDDHVARSHYAGLAYLAMLYPEAHAQFEILGDNLTTWPHFPNYPLATLKQIREQVAREVAAKPRK